MSELKHNLSRAHGGSNEMGWTQPFCSCGWQGSKVYNWNDFKHANLKDQEAAHSRAARDTHSGASNV